MIGGLRSPSSPHPLHTFRIYPPPSTPVFEYTFCTPISNPAEHGVEDAVHEIHTDNNLPHLPSPTPTHPLHGVDTRHKTQTHTHYTELTNTHTHTHTHTTGQDRPEENCRSSCDGEGYNKVQQMQEEKTIKQGLGALKVHQGHTTGFENGKLGGTRHHQDYVCPEVWNALEAGTSPPQAEKYTTGVSFSLQPFQTHTHTEHIHFTHLPPPHPPLPHHCNSVLCLTAHTPQTNSTPTHTHAIRLLISLTSKRRPTPFFFNPNRVSITERQTSSSWAIGGSRRRLHHPPRPILPISPHATYPNLSLSHPMPPTPT